MSYSDQFNLRLSPALRQKIRLAAASAGMQSGEWVRYVVEREIQNFAERSPGIALMFHAVDVECDTRELVERSA